MRVHSVWVIVACLVAGRAEGATLRVPIQYTTISAALAAATDGDTILVGPGTYSGAGNRDLKIVLPHLTLRSELGAATTTIDAGGSGTCLTIDNAGMLLSTEVSGFTFQGATTSAVVVTNCAPSLLSCEFTGNTGSRGGGLFADGFAGTLLDCKFIENNAVSAEGFAGDGGGLYLLNSATWVLNCLVLGNHADGVGGGVAIQGGMSGGRTNYLQGCLVSGNTALDGAGLSLGAQASSGLASCTVAGNSATSDGGGIKVDEASTFGIGESIIWGNCAGSQGPQLWSEGGSLVAVDCTDLDFSEVGSFVDDTFGRSLTVDPQFCRTVPCSRYTDGNYTLAADSPLWGLCGGDVLGYTNEACTEVAVNLTTWGGIKSRYAGR